MLGIVFFPLPPVDRKQRVPGEASVCYPLLSAVAVSRAASGMGVTAFDDRVGPQQYIIFFLGVMRFYRCRLVSRVTVKPGYIRGRGGLTKQGTHAGIMSSRLL